MGGSTGNPLLRNLSKICVSITRAQITMMMTAKPRSNRQKALSQVALERCLGLAVKLKAVVQQRFELRLNGRSPRFCLSECHTKAKYFTKTSTNTVIQLMGYDALTHISTQSSWKHAV